MKGLYACLYVGDFPVAACLRERWNRQPPATLVFSGTPPNAYVYSANGEARVAGVREGMTLSQAEARFIVSEAAVKRKAKLLALPRDEQAEQQAQRELLDAALNVSPRVESSGPGLLVLDLNGLPNPHRAADVLAQQAERLGLASNVAVSQNRFVAVAAAQTQPGITHVFPDEVRGFLGRLPIGIFPLTSEERKILRLWGIRTWVNSRGCRRIRWPPVSAGAGLGWRGWRKAKTTPFSRLGKRRALSNRAWISIGRSANSIRCRSRWRSCCERFAEICRRTVRRLPEFEFR